MRVGLESRKTAAQKVLQQPLKTLPLPSSKLLLEERLLRGLFITSVWEQFAGLGAKESPKKEVHLFST